jgi:SAM-dependent methyltransferase
MPCNLCGSSNVKVLFRSDSYPDGYKNDTLRCRKCGLVFRDSQENVDPSGYGVSCQNKRRDYPDNWNRERLRIFNEGVSLASKFRKLNRVLDVGSGYGFFLKRCQENGWEVWGVDMNPELVKFSKEEFGMRVSNGSFEEADYSNGFFDVVTFFNVLEHLSDPFFALKKAYSILRPGGALFLRFSNAVLHVPIRMVMYKLHKLWKPIKRFDNSSISQYAFNRSCICCYLRKVGFEDYVVANTRPTASFRSIEALGLEEMVGLIGLGVSNFIKIMTRGRHLVAPSLSAIAIKPSLKKNL